jgi:hypothetical protein
VPTYEEQITGIIIKHVRSLRATLWCALLAQTTPTPFLHSPEKSSVSEYACIYNTYTCILRRSPAGGAGAERRASSSSGRGTRLQSVKTTCLNFCEPESPVRPALRGGKGGCGREGEEEEEEEEEVHLPGPSPAHTLGYTGAGCQDVRDTLMSRFSALACQILGRNSVFGVFRL